MLRIPAAVAGLIALFLTAAWSPEGSPGAETVPTPIPAPVDGGAQEFTVDGGHSSMVFRVIHLGAAPFWGTFNQIGGSFRFDDESPDNSFVKVEIAAASVDSNNERRDGHLKSPDFFNAAEHPKLTFESSKVEAAGDAAYKVTGTLTIGGVAKEIEVPVQHIGTKDAGERFGLRSGYEARFTIDRTEFGVLYGANSGALGKDVQIILALEGMVAK